MSGRLKKNMGFSLIPFAFFFLFEPSYGLIDPLPDFIGYSILCISIIHLADINDKISVALKSFQKGIVLGLLRFASIFILDSFFADTERTVGLLLFVFTFAILELTLIIPGYKALFEGLLSLGIFEGGNSIFQKRREKGKNMTEKAYILTLAFIIFKNVICALPEFTSLQTNGSYEFVNIMRVLAIMLVTPISVFWLINTVLYFIRIKKDGEFIRALSEKYSEKASASQEVFIFRTLSSGLYIMLAAFVFIFDLYSENINVLPDFIFYSIIIFVCLFLKRYSKNWGGVAVSSTCGALVSLATYFIEKNFFSRFEINAVIKNIDAYNQYNLLVILYAVKAIAFLAVLFFILRFIYDVFLSSVGHKHTNNDAYFSEHDIKIKIKAFICFFLGLLCSISTVYRVISLPYFELSWIFYYSGIITGIIEIAFITAIFTLILSLHGEIKYNYKSFL